MAMSDAAMSRRGRVHLFKPGVVGVAAVVWCGRFVRPLMVDNPPVLPHVKSPGAWLSVVERGEHCRRCWDAARRACC